MECALGVDAAALTAVVGAVATGAVLPLRVSPKVRSWKSPAAAAPATLGLMAEVAEVPEWLSWRNDAVVIVVVDMPWLLWCKAGRSIWLTDVSRATAVTAAQEGAMEPFLCGTAA